MNPAEAVNLAIVVLDQILSLIAHLKGQAGMSSDAILEQAQAQNLANAKQIADLLASLEPPVPPVV